MISSSYQNHAEYLQEKGSVGCQKGYVNNKFLAPQQVFGVCFVPHYYFILYCGSLESMPQQHVEFYTWVFIGFVETSEYCELNNYVVFVGYWEGILKVSW